MHYNSEIAKEIHLGITVSAEAGAFLTFLREGKICTARNIKKCANQTAQGASYKGPDLESTVPNPLCTSAWKGSKGMRSPSILMYPSS